MTIKDILLHLEPGEPGRAAREFAVSLAAATGAHLTAAGVALQYVAPGGSEDAGAMEYLLEITDQARQAAEAAYKDLQAAAPAGVGTDFVMIETLSAIARDRFGALARHFDLAVVGQGGAASDEDDLMASGALFGSGRGVFVVPTSHVGPARLDSAMVCWDGGLAAARALAEATPLLEKAKRVEVVGLRKDDAAAPELPGFNITRHLARHGVQATLTTLPPAADVGAALLAQAKKSGADFMVMGGYGHWRVRELVLGGATRTVLRDMHLPVLMAH
jgi:nucleotide-binding universal stress UspA family protein